MIEKCYQLFLSGIGNEKTRKKYEYYLERFLNESKIKSYSSLIELDDDTRQDIIEKYLLMLKEKGLKRSSIRPVLYAIELFYDKIKKSTKSFNCKTCNFGNFINIDSKSRISDKTLYEIHVESNPKHKLEFSDEVIL